MWLFLCGCSRWRSHWCICFFLSLITWGVKSWEIFEFIDERIMYAVFALVIIFIVNILINIALYFIQFKIVSRLNLLYFVYLTLFLRLSLVYFTFLLYKIMVSHWWYLTYYIWLLLCHFNLKLCLFNYFLWWIWFNLLSFLWSIIGTEARAAWEDTFFVIFIWCGLNYWIRLILFICANGLERSRL